jgi:hypothetical protein
VNGNGDTYPDRYDAVNAFEDVVANDADVDVEAYDADVAYDADIDEV